MGEFAGRLREHILIEAPSSGRTALGAQVAEHEVVARSLAAVAPDGTGAEAEGQALSAMARFRVTIRAPSAAEVGHRVTWRGRRMAVRQRIDDPALPDRVVLRCEEIRT